MTREKFVVEGLGGKKTLRGEVAVRGAKNAALKFLAASVLFEDTLECSNVPDIEDVRRMGELLQVAGAEVTTKDGVVSVVPPDFAKASSGKQVAFMAPTEILAKQHFVSISNLLKNFNITIL